MKRITKASLDRLAKGQGFQHFQEMLDRLNACADDQALAIDLVKLQHQLKQPIADEATGLPPRSGLADVEVDASGLPQINDLVLTVSRMIVKLLFGYTADEMQFLYDRELDIEAKEAHENYHRSRRVSLGR
ncbi:MAG: hypothetical protein H5U28_14905 [Burkholderiaceae bacterium]|nr:hypothetical protein [Burkholderiaceae bacterium]